MFDCCLFYKKKLQMPFYVKKGSLNRLWRKKLSELILYKDKECKLGMIKDEKGSKITLQTDEAKKTVIQKNQLICRSGKEAEHQLSYYQAAVKPVNSEELYELLNGMAESFTFEELAQLYYSEDFTTEQMFCLVMTAAVDEIRFSIQGNKVFLRTADEIAALTEEKRKKEEEELAQKAANDAAWEWIRDNINKEVFTSSPKLLPACDNPPAEAVRILLPLKDLLIHGEDYSRKNECFKRIDEICEKCAVVCSTDKFVWSYKLLFHLGILQNDDELVKRRNNLKTAYPPIPDGMLPLPVSDGIEREDMTDLNVFTIDSEQTKDIDDGLSWKNCDDGYKFYVHIADPDAFIRRGSVLDKEAFTRGTSVYMTTERINMFPPEIIYSHFNLTEGEKRPSVTLEIFTDKDYSIKSTRFCFVWIKVRHRLTYNEADSVLENSAGEKPDWYEAMQHFQKLSLKCEAKRVADGAYLIERPDIHLIVGNDGKIKLDLLYSNSASHIIVREMMIMFNKLTAQTMILHQTPSIFISQSSPDKMQEENPNVNYDKHRDFSRYELIQLLITMKKSVTGTTAGPHFTMGLPYYTQATSPIRRYLDITEHRLLKGVITGKKELMPDENEIQVIIATITAKAANAALCERESKSFWMLRYLEQNMDATYRILITKKITGGFLGEIEDLCVRIPVFGSANLKIGSYVNAKLKKVSPITGESRAEVVFKA